MKREWFLAKDLIDIPGLPSTPQGINKRAKIEGWLKRATSVPGVRGRSFEYHVDSLPAAIRGFLRGDSLDSSTDVVHEPRTAYTTAAKNPGREEWTRLYDVMTADEQERLLQLVKRKGVEALVSMVEEENLQLIAMPAQVKKLALILQELPREKLREIFDYHEKNEQNHTVIIDKKQVG